MKSTEKIRSIIDEALEQGDTELSSVVPFPIPAGMLRMGLNAMEEHMPSDPAELDALIRKGIEFAGRLLSDQEPADATG